MIAIIDSGGANIASIQFALERLGASSILTRDIQAIRSAKKVILPGVGTANHAMQKLAELDLIAVIKALTQPVLGICLGMQLLYEFSEEGTVSTLGVVPGNVKKFEYRDNLAIPHMGWNKLKIKSTASKLFQEIENNSHVYFVHSFCAPVTDNTSSITQYGETFSASVEKNNFYGVQFHPERSGDVGQKILENFLLI